MIRANAIKKLAKNEQLFLLIRLSKLVTPFYKVGYIASLHKYGFMKELKDQPQTLEQLSEKIGIRQGRQEALQAWLQVGIRMKLLKITECYFSSNNNLISFALKTLCPFSQARCMAVWFCIIFPPQTLKL